MTGFGEGFFVAFGKGEGVGRRGCKFEVPDLHEEGVGRDAGFFLSGLEGQNEVATEFFELDGGPAPEGAGNGGGGEEVGFALEEGAVFGGPVFEAGFDFVLVEGFEEGLGLGQGPLEGGDPEGAEAFVIGPEFKADGAVSGEGAGVGSFFELDGWSLGRGRFFGWRFSAVGSG